MSQVKITAVAVMLVFVVLSIEVLSVGFYAVRKGDFFYAVSRADLETSINRQQVGQAVFHPYISFLHRVGREMEDFGTNNHGWAVHKSLLAENERCCDYPLQKRDKDILVGVFGGSVGQGFAMAAQRSDSLARALGGLPEYADANFVIMNFSMPAFKQPQQLLTLAYYLSLGQKFDLIINIDGFNEAVTSFQNWQSGVDPSFPADSIWGEMGRHIERLNNPISNSEQLEAIWRDRAAAQARMRAGQCGLASCWVFYNVMSIWHGYLRDTFGEIQQSTRSASLFPDGDVKPKEGFNIADWTADIWMNSSVSMAQLDASQGTRFVNIIQPNQWYKESGEYTPIEPDHPYNWVSDPVNQAYDAMRARLPEMKSRNVDVLDASSLLAPNSTMYSDDCCHYTAEGYDLLFKSLAAHLRRTDG